MIQRTTIEIDSELLARAKSALGIQTTRGTVEEALRRAAASAEKEREGSAFRQRAYLARLGQHLDTDVLGSDSMWR